MSHSAGNVSLSDSRIINYLHFLSSTNLYAFKWRQFKSFLPDFLRPTTTSDTFSYTHFISSQHMPNHLGPPHHSSETTSSSSRL